jgi:hypothetical protein
MLPVFFEIALGICDLSLRFLLYLLLLRGAKVLRDAFPLLLGCVQVTTVFPLVMYE